MATGGTPDTGDALASEFTSTFEGAYAGEGEETETGESQTEGGEGAEGTEGAPPVGDGTPAVGGEAGSGKAGQAGEGEAAKGTPQADGDPYAGTEPFTYEVNGEKKTLEGVYRVPGEGLLVPEDRVQAVQQLFADRDQFDRTARDTQGRVQELERLATWHEQTPDGKTRTLQGRDGLVAMRVQGARMHAAFNTVAAVLRDPQKFASLIGGVDANNRIVLDQNAIEHLLTESDLAEMKAEQQIRSQMGAFLQQGQQQDALAQQQARGYTPEQLQPVIDAAAKAATFDASALTPKDKAFLAQQVSAYLIPGTQTVNPAFVQVIKDRVELRAEASKAAQAAEAAGKHNAGMQRGRQPQRQPATAPVRQPPNTEDAAPKKKADWDTPFATFMEEALQPR